MKSMLITILLIVALLGFACLASCSKPYSAPKAASILNEWLGTEIELIEEKTVDGTPYEDGATTVLAKNIYVFRDKKSGFDFIATATVERFYAFVIIHTGRVLHTDYVEKLMSHYTQQAAALAEKYNVRYIRAKPKYFDYEIDNVYISSPEQLSDVVDLFYELGRLYDFNIAWDDYQYYAKNFYINRPFYSVSYLPEDDLNTDNAVEFAGQRAIYPGGTGKKRYSHATDTPQEYLYYLSYQWDKAWAEGKIPVPIPSRDFEKMKDKWWYE